MSTIHSLHMLAVDLEQRVVREMQFQGDTERQVVDALATVREAFNHLENVILSAFQERSRALAAVLGSGRPNPDTFDAEAAAKIAMKPKTKFGKSMVVEDETQHKGAIGATGAVGAE